MKLYELDEYVSLHREINSSGLSDAAKMRLKDCLQEQFDIENAKPQTSETPKPSNAEIQIAMGMFSHPDEKRENKVDFSKPDIRLATKLFRDRSGLSLFQAKLAIKEAIAARNITHEACNPSLDETEKQEIRNHYAKHGFDYMYEVARSIAHDKQIIVSDAMDMIEQFVKTF